MPRTKPAKKSNEIGSRVPSPPSVITDRFNLIGIRPAFRYVTTGTGRKVKRVLLSYAQLKSVFNFIDCEVGNFQNAAETAEKETAAAMAKVDELHGLLDQLKRENERLKLMTDGGTKIPSNLANFDLGIADGAYVRKTNGGSGGSI